MAEIALEDGEYVRASEQGEWERTEAPVPLSVQFDHRSGRIVVEFENGAALLVPARALQGLETASDAALAEVELAGETGLHWGSLDVDFTIGGLMRGVFGTAKFMNAQRKGGLSRSAAKVAASRANGSKGGRPKRASLP